MWYHRRDISILYMFKIRQRSSRSCHLQLSCRYSNPIPTPKKTNAPMQLCLALLQLFPLPLGRLRDLVTPS